MFATEIPEDYEPHTFDLEYLKEMGKDVEASLKEYRRRKEKNITERVVEIDTDRDSEDEEKEDPETIPESVDSPSLGPSAEPMAPSSGSRRTLPIISSLRKSVIIQTQEPSYEHVNMLEMGVYNHNPSLPQAPILVTKKQTAKNVPTRASSQRIKNKKQCNSC